MFNNRRMHRHIKVFNSMDYYAIIMMVIKNTDDYMEYTLKEKRKYKLFLHCD